MILVLAACAGPAVETGPAPPTTRESTPAETGACAGVPLVTWDTFGRGFITGACQTCHASTAPDRHGAPAEVVFDTEEQVWALAPLVLEVAARDEPTMPPEGGVSDEDRQLLAWWLSCGAP